MLYLYMLSCRALERSNNLFIESIVEFCVSKNQKRIFTVWAWLEWQSWKRAETIEKCIFELEAEFVYVRRKMTALKFM